jgi:uncharacterized tellurite resistance protein B-like protein
MFRAFRDLLNDILPPDTPAPPGEPSLRLAAAVLLMEVMRADGGGIGADERHAAAVALQEQFGLADGEWEPLLRQAEQESRTAYDYFRFTNPLDQQLAQPAKVDFIEAMWRVALADDQLGVAENSVIRQVAELLHVTHGEYIAAKLRAREAQGAA